MRLMGKKELVKDYKNATLIQKLVNTLSFSPI